MLVNAGKTALFCAAIMAATIAGSFAAPQDDERSYLPPGTTESQSQADARTPGKSKGSPASKWAADDRASGKAKTKAKARKQYAKSTKAAVAGAARPRKVKLRLSRRQYQGRYQRGWRSYGYPRYRYASPGLLTGIFGLFH
jgi:hypothetical protein